MKEKLRVRGIWEMTLHNKTEGIKKIWNGENVVVDIGKEYLAQFLAVSVAAPAQFGMQWVAIGTNATPESSADIDLVTEVARVQGVASYVSNQIYQLTASFTSGIGTGPIVEYGVFDSAANGVMLCRDTEGVVTKGLDDELVCRVQIVFS